MKKILVPCDFSKPAINAFRFALDVAAQSKGTIHLLNVIELPVMHDTVLMPVLNFEEQLFKDLKENADARFKTITDKYSVDGIKVITRTVFGSVFRMIQDYITAESINVVIMGSHGSSGVREFFIGSNAEKMVRNSPVPVLVIKDYFKGPIKSIVFPNTLFTSDDASAPVLEKLHECGVRFVLLRSVGYDHIDLGKAATLGMRVANVPQYSPYSVAEHGVAMLMTLNRKIIQGQHLLELQDFRIDSLKGFDIHGKTTGVIGTGKIGMAFARIMLGFGAKVLAYDPVVNDDAVKLGIQYVSLDELVETSDIVSLHCPLNQNTKHLLSDVQFSRIKKGAIIINTSRGAIINTVHLIEALDKGLIGGACLDVYEFEKGLFFEDHRTDIIHDVNFARLRNFSNVIITGHQGFLTADAIKQIAETTIANLDCYQNAIPCKNELVWVDDVQEKSKSKAQRILSL